MKKTITSFLTILLFTFSISAISSAQTFGTTVDPSDIDLILSPEFPSAFETVRLRLNSNTINLNLYQIDWFVNSQPVQNGVGLREYQLTMGGYGSTTNLSVIVRLGYTNIQKQVSLNPQDTTVLWEATNTYVPPFYKGKKLPGRESDVTITAIPHFSSITGVTTDNAVFLWNRNGNRILNVGGYAKNSITIAQNRMRESENITAIVTSRDETYRAEKTVTIPTVSPEINWYTKDSSGYRRLLSINNGARVSSEQESIQIVAEPFFFTTFSPKQLTYSWKMNGDSIYLDPTKSPTELLVRNPGTIGQVTFGISTENPFTFLQVAQRNLSLYFQ